MNDTRNTEGDCIDLALARIDRNETMIHSEIRLLHDYWQSLREGRTVPFRAEIDPRDMRCNARNLFILEDLGNGNIRFRLAGTGLVEAFGMELRGMSARTLMEGRARESFAALIEETLAEPGIGYARLSSSTGDGEVWEVLLLPLRSDFGAVDRVLGCLHPVAGKARASRERLRFRIEDMSIRQVDGTDEPVREQTRAQGFAEVQAPFGAPAPAGHGRFTAIEGGRADRPADEGERRRPSHLRLVEDD